jgi:hypothetical protein
MWLLSHLVGSNHAMLKACPELGCAWGLTSSHTCATHSTPAASAVFAAGGDPEILPKKRGNRAVPQAKVPKQHASDTPGSAAAQVDLTAEDELLDSEGAADSDGVPLLDEEPAAAAETGAAPAGAAGTAAAARSAAAAAGAATGNPGRIS